MPEFHCYTWQHEVMANFGVCRPLGTAVEHCCFLILAMSFPALEVATALGGVMFDLIAMHRRVRAQA